MSRSVIMVDAGYVYAEGGNLCCGTRSRAQLVLDSHKLIGKLQAQLVFWSMTPVLRAYWYDAARDGIRTAEQRQIAALDDVKLRLGRLNAQNQQKGVDALIYRDMITLAQHKAVTDVLLVSGDEDLREAVRSVQDYGVRVTLVGIEPVKGHNQSEELVLEADRVWVLDKEFMSDVFAPRVVDSTRDAAPIDGSAAVAAAVIFAQSWRARATEAELIELLADRPRIPRPVDIELITAVERAVGDSLVEHPSVKKDVRAAWWGVLGGTMPRATA